VVLNWHGRAHTLACLQALRALDYHDWCLVLVDNGCSDFSAEEVDRLVPGACYVRTETNLGFAGGANLGCREALARGAAYVWFLNNDARPEPGALAELIAAAAHDTRLAIVGAKILQAGDPSRLDSIALRLDLHSGRTYLLGHDEVDRGQYDTLDDAIAVTACAMLASARSLQQLRGFDETFFAYLEDADLCLRARAAGFRIGVAPKARVLHARPSARAGRQSISSLYYTARNHLLLMDRHAPQSWPRRWFRVATISALNAAYALRSGSRPFARLEAVRRGVRDYRRGITGAARCA